MFWKCSIKYLNLFIVGYIQIKKNMAHGSKRESQGDKIKPTFQNSPQKRVKILIVPLFWLKFDDVTVTLSLIVLS